jgi:mono/diheme cytochrome c family protein
VNAEENVPPLSAMNREKSNLHSLKRFKAILIVLGLTLSGCSGPAIRTHSQAPAIDSELAIVSGSTNRIVTSLRMLQALPKAKVTVNDPVYGRAKRYAGFWLEDVLKLAGIGLDSEHVLVFSSLDGYQARLSRLPMYAKPLLAIRDLDNQTGWEVITHGKEKLTPGPFYLVWQTPSGAKASEPGLPWPYQITRLELRNLAESQRQLLPQGADARPEVMRGFNLFMKSCISCHSLNLEGGVLGPELNIPQNITDYRDWAYLIQFIKDPSSFRARSKMPAFKNSLSDEAIDDVLQYFRWMRSRKVLLNN